MSTIYGKTTPVPTPFEGIVDFVVDIPDGRPARILQLTDMQLIDAAQQRYPDRLNAREIELWQPESIPVQCLDHIKSVVAQTTPDLIFITGDVIYGEFDDTGRSFTLFCDFMDSLGIPWAPVYGNHDNESRMGVDWQNSRFEAGELCLFKRGSVTGNGNYTVLITRDGKPTRVLYMMDSGACGGAAEPHVRRPAGLSDDQMAWFADTASALAEINGGAPVAGVMGFHIPCVEFHIAATEKGYQSDNPSEMYVIGVTAPAQDGDFGCKRETHSMFRSPEGFVDTLHRAGVDGVFVGHCHAINTSVLWQGIRWTYGLKTGQYDYHTVGQVGGTLVTLSAHRAPAFTVTHVPSLVSYAPEPNPPRY